MEYKNTIFNKAIAPKNISLNPCSNGIQKYRLKKRTHWKALRVLILVLMEYKNTDTPSPNPDPDPSLNPCSNGIQKYDESMLLASWVPKS